MFVIGRQGSAVAGSVIWFAGDAIDRFPGFDEYFAAMVDYNRLELERLSRETR